MEPQVGESMDPDVDGARDREGVYGDAPTWAGSTLVLAAAVRADDVAGGDGAVAELGLGVACGVDGRGGAVAPDPTVTVLTVVNNYYKPSIKHV